MNSFRFFHVFANGSDASNFIVSERDFVFQFNLVGICSHDTKAKVVAFSIEETHPHFLLYGPEEQCLNYKTLYSKLTLRHISASRGSSDGVSLNLEMYPIEDVGYLRNVAAYVAVQSTKDGKPVMFYDYKWGSGSMYFRDSSHIPIWIHDTGSVCKSIKKISDLDAKTRQLVCARHILPANWEVCDNLILPNNYLDVKMFEDIFQTHNCFRVFACASARHTAEIMERMANVRGLCFNDYEAREIASRHAFEEFKTHDIRRLDLPSRLKLSLLLRRKYKMSTRQLSTVCRLPEEEISKYIR